MAATCWSSIRGKRVRATKTDSCCAPIASATCGQIVTDGFISVKYSPEIESGEDIVLKNADGAACVTDRGCDFLKYYTVEIEFCRVDPDLFTFMTGQPTVVDFFGNSVGNRVNTSITCEGGFSLETWSDIPNQACSSTGTKSYGYFLIPCITHATVGDFTIENAAATFTIKGFSRAPANWGIGPFDVVANNAAGLAGPLLTPIQPTEHLHLQLTTIAPPAASCGCKPLAVNTPSATCASATAVTATTATLSGVANFAPASGTARIVYGTTSTGPYTSTAVTAVGTGAAGQALTGPATGLTAGTTYYYRTEVLNGAATVIASSTECSFTATAAGAPTATCAPATGITATQATLSGTVDNAPLTSNVEIHLGTTTGGPYPTVVASTSGNNTVGQAVGPTLATGLTTGTTYFYVTVVLNPGQVATSTQCTFTTT